MLEVLERVNGGELIAILAVGGGLLTGIIAIIGGIWYKGREIAWKQEMVRSWHVCRGDSVGARLRRQVRETAIRREPSLPQLTLGKQGRYSKWHNRRRAGAALARRFSDPRLGLKHSAVSGSIPDPANLTNRQANAAALLAS